MLRHHTAETIELIPEIITFEHKHVDLDTEKVQGPQDINNTIILTTESTQKLVT